MTTTRQLPRSERHATILRGAAKAFAQGGYAATSMEDIAAASGITKLIVYRHFESKQDLYQAVLQRVTERLSEEFRAAHDRGGDDGAGARALLIVAREDSEAFTLLFRHAAREPQFEEYARDYRDRAVQGTANRLSASIADAVLLRWAAETTISFLVSAVLNWLDVGDPRRDDVFIALTGRAMRETLRVWSTGDA